MIGGQNGDVYSAAATVGTEPDEILDFSAGINPVTVADSVRRALDSAVDALGRYPDPSASRLRERAARRLGVSPEQVLAGNGSTEFIYAIPRGLRPRRVVVIAPCYHDYWRAVEHAGGETEGVLASEAKEFVPDMKEVEARLSGADMIFIGNPNSPTGVAFAADAIRSAAERFPSVTFVVDESFADFVPGSQGTSLLGASLPKNVSVLRSLSAFYALPGLRLGFMIGSRELCTQVDRAREPWTVSGLAMRAGEALLDSDPDPAALREPVIAERERVRYELSNLPGLRVFPSQANFLLLKITRSGLTSSRLCERMLRQKILIKNAAGFRGLDSKFVRVSIRSSQDNDRLLQAIRDSLDEAKWK